MKVVFMGTGEIALPSLRALLDSGHEVCAVVTQPDRPVGRHQEMHPPEPKVLAVEAGVPVLQPENLRRSGDRVELEELAPELIVVMAYGQILPQEVLDLPGVACINVHASLLPRHRGASCLQAAIAEGDEVSGVTVMHVVKKLDAGDIILKREIPLAQEETGGSLHDRLAALAPDVLLEAIDLLARGEAPREVQDESLSTYAPKLLREDGRLDWSRPAVELERLIRAYDPWPGTFTVFSDARGREKRLKVFPGVRVSGESLEPGLVRVGEDGALLVGCGEGCLQLAGVQPDGGRRMSSAEFAAGHIASGQGRFF